ncbi:hypothetical protein [Paragemmobacter aquarius]|nr:hypothetical protein [Gemmobacter aquarius]
MFYSELLRLIGENLGIAAMLIAFPLVVLARLWPYIRLMKRKSKDAP